MTRHRSSHHNRSFDTEPNEDSRCSRDAIPGTEELYHASATTCTLPITHPGTYVDVEQPRHLFFRKVQRRLVLRYARVRNHAVEPAGLFHHLFKGTSHIVDFGDVDSQS